MEIALARTTNESILEKQQQKVLEDSIKNLTDTLRKKEIEITDFQNEVEVLELTYSNEVQDKHEHILNLTTMLDIATDNIAIYKSSMREKKNETSILNSKLREARADVHLLKAEKGNLLQIIQKLAVIGHPGINFKAIEDKMLDEEGLRDNNATEKVVKEKEVEPKEEMDKQAHLVDTEEHHVETKSEKLMKAVESTKKLEMKPDQVERIFMPVRNH